MHIYIFFFDIHARIMFESIDRSFARWYTAFYLKSGLDETEHGLKNILCVVRMYIETKIIVIGKYRARGS